MIRRPTTLFAALAAGSALSAQTIVSVSPPHFANAEGNSQRNPPFAQSNLPATWQEVDDSLLGSPRTIHGIRFRRDGFYPFASMPFSCRLSIRMSHARTTAATIANTFAANHAPNPAVVLNATFPPLSLPGGDAAQLPEPFAFDFPFQQPFLYNGTAPLCWDMAVTSISPATAFQVDYATGTSANPFPYSIVRGTGCVATGQAQPAALGVSFAPNWTATPPAAQQIGSTWSCARLLPNAYGMLLLSAGVPPFSVPGSACTLYVDTAAPMIAIPFLTQPNGTASINETSPLSPALNGLDLLTQAGSMDPTTFAIALTNALEVNVVSPWTTLPVSSLPTNGGTPRLNEGFVVEYY